MLSPRFIVLFLTIISLVFPILGQSAPGYYIEHKKSFDLNARRVVAASNVASQERVSLDQRIGYEGRLWDYNSATSAVFVASQPSLCLQVSIPANRASGLPVNNDFVELATCSNSNAQKWTLPPANQFGSFELQAYPGFCLVAAMGGTDVGTSIRIYTCDSSNTNRRFKWDYDSLASTTSADSVATTTADSATTSSVNSATTSANSVATTQNSITTSVNSVATSVNSFTTSVNSATTSFNNAATSLNSASTSTANSASTSADNSASTAAHNSVTTGAHDSTTTTAFNSATTGALNRATTSAVDTSTTTGFHTTTTGAYAATTGFSDIPFFIRHKLSTDSGENRVLTAVNAADGARITLQLDWPRTSRLWRYNSITQQIVSWDFQTLCLSVTVLGTAPANNDPLIVQTCNVNSPVQKWSPDSFSGYAKLRLSMYPNMCVASYSGFITINNPLNLWTCDKTTTTANRMYKLDVPTYP